MGQLISITAPKSGHGTTTIALNLAVTFAQNGARVCYIDANFENDDVWEEFGVFNKDIDFYLDDFLQSHCDIEETIIPMNERVIGKLSGKFDAIFSKNMWHIPPQHRKSYDFESFGKILALQHIYDYIVIDAGHGVSEENTFLLGLSDSAIIINAKWNTRGWTSAVVMGDIAAKFNIDTIVLLANKIPKHLLSRDYDDLAYQIGNLAHPPFSLSAVMPSLEDIGGIPDVFTLENPNHPVTNLFIDLAQYFSNPTPRDYPIALTESEIRELYADPDDATGTKRKIRVFLCHASQDKPVVRQLHRKLISLGWVDPWLDEEKLLPGEDWNLAIEKAVEATDVVFVCLSKKSINKEGYIQKEIRNVVDVSYEKPEGTIFLIPIRLEECEVPRKLSKQHWVNYYEEEAFDKIKKSLKARLEDIERKEQIL